MVTNDFEVLLIDVTLCYQRPIKKKLTKKWTNQI